MLRLYNNMQPVFFSSDGGDGDWCGHRHCAYCHPHFFHLTENPASKSVNAIMPFSSCYLCTIIMIEMIVVYYIYFTSQT